MAHMALFYRTAYTYEGNHVHHGRITRYKKEESDSHDIGFLNVASAELLISEFADEIVLRVFQAKIH